MASVGRDYCQARRAAPVMLAAVVSVLACWRDWVSVAVAEVEFVFDLVGARSDVGPEGCSKMRWAAAESWEVALVSYRTDPAVEDVAFLGPEAELLGLQEPRLDQLLDVEEHPAVVPRTDRMMDHDVAVLAAGGLVGLDA